MNIYFVAILVVLFLEKILIWYGIKAAFEILIPLACFVGVLFIVTNCGPHAAYARTPRHRFGTRFQI